MINELVGAILQLLVFTAIPFIVFLIQKKTTKGFLDYIGLKRSTTKANLLALLIVLIIIVPMFILMFTNQEFQLILTDPSSTTGKIRQMGGGFETVMIILIAAGLKTSLTEEIFFRGFVAKRLIAVTNFPIGNAIQAILFGVIHGLLFLSITKNPLFLTVITLFPAIAAYLKVYLNEKVAIGSIIPGWIAHGVGNVIAYSTVAFLL